MIYQSIQVSIKNAMRSKDINRRDVLKMVVNKAQAIAKEGKVELSDEVVIDAVLKELKQLEQTKDSLLGKEDCDLYKSTIEKISILQPYIPKMMEEDEVTRRVEEILSNVNVDNKGSAMKLVMPKLKGKADNKIIAKCVDNYIKKVK